jgi:hypothetical protein
MRGFILPVVMSVGIILAGCGGRAANPVMIAQYGDAKKSCAALELEMSQMQESIQKLVPKTEKTGKNVALGVTGAFLLVPLFFMDLSQAEQMEVDAFRQRYNHLAVIATDKECATEAKPIAPFNETTADADKKKTDALAENAEEKASAKDGADKSGDTKKKD